MKKLAMVLPVLVAIAAIVFLAVHRRENAQHVNREINAEAATHFSFAEQLALARAACGSGQVSVDAKKQIACSTCPDGSDYAGSGPIAGSGTGWTLDGAIPGSFSARDADEALVHATGCESHAKNYGGDFLMRRTDANWSTERYASGGTATDKCQKVTWDGGRLALVCEVTDMHQGVASDAVQLLLFDAKQPPLRDFLYGVFLAIEDQSSNCGFDVDLNAKPHIIQLAKIEKVEVLPAGSDGREDVAIDMMISRVISPVHAQSPCPAGNPQRRHLVFNNAGDHFDAGEGYVALHAMKREDCCGLTVTPRVIPGRY